ncbi:MAG TPA: pyridoxamine 5'-phosphate oxidase family protein [Candidatus Borkfalkia excrementavium]|uniref:Pyridoxamine 5'-phosphate oxidase family protein n=1 Tax=Candidatus Borkfalkia excrementavium TaxID=2838505 RepID=A0A9D1Z8U5_9FIRM|nr:pyridoxamine 5'-phosphate oxidase family protein [Candidatus Borkfalkia excrementavium]
MRKSQREISDFQEKKAALLACGFLTLAVGGESAPYLVPLDFGAEEREGKLILYFHCAKEGKKLDLLRKDPNVGFCAARQFRVFNNGTAPCGFTADYESVCGRGVASVLSDRAERLHGLKVLMAHYTEEGFSDESFLERPLALAEVVRVDVTEFTGKRLVRG